MKGILYLKFSFYVVKLVWKKRFYRNKRKIIIYKDDMVNVIIIVKEFCIWLVRKRYKKGIILRV